MKRGDNMSEIISKGLVQERIDEYIESNQDVVELIDKNKE